MSPAEVLVHVFNLVVPEMVLGVAACVLFLGSTFRPNRHLWGGVALIALAAAGVALYATQPTVPLTGDAIYISPILLDPLAVLIKAFALAGGFVLVLFSWDAVSDRWAGEFHACLLLIVAGVGLTAAANELITLFLALELISIPTYILLYLMRFDDAAQEAAMKYFFLSVFSSAILLFGFSYLYGLAGTTNLSALVDALTKQGPNEVPVVVQIALVMVVAGLGFKITAVPFHFYAPDVYQGTATPGAALLAFAPKVAGFVALVRVLGLVWGGGAGSGFALGEQVPILLWILAAVTMFLGNILALLQDNIKRLLAYSSVAHAGYMLIGLAVAPALARRPVTDMAGAGDTMAGGVEAVLFYLVTYSAMTVGAFAVLAYLSTRERPVETVDDLAGLGRSHPGLALLMVIFLFSLIGIPLTGGFVGKLLLFLGAMSINEPPLLYRGLALIGVLNAAIGAWYYLRIAAVMYLRSPIKPLERSRLRPALVALWICAAVTVATGLPPVMDSLREAASTAAARPIR
jgi:NADH-quinone oxidoreductase subunit N